MAGSRSGAERRPPAGFTLFEVLIALAVIAIALSAASRSAGLTVSSAHELKLRTLAGFVAENRISEMVARRAWPAPGMLEGVETQAGIAFRWRAEIAATPHPSLRRVELAVLDPSDAAHELRRVVGVLSRDN